VKIKIKANDQPERVLLTQSPRRVPDRGAPASPAAKPLTGVPMPPSTAALEVHGLSKQYGGVHAVDGLSFAAYPGRITGLVGPNGAGKTTALNLITGVETADAGTLRVLGAEVAKGWRPHQIARLGVLRTFQTARVFPNLNVLENVLAGAKLSRVRDEAAKVALALSLLDVFGLRERAGDRATMLSTGSQKLVEFARLLLAEPRVLLLDEPAAGLSEAETRKLADTLVAMKNLGLAVVLIDHNLRLVMGVCDHVAVMDAGAVIAAGTPAQVQADAKVRAAYIGSTGAAPAPVVGNTVVGGPVTGSAAADKERS
jgi:branched-chain amino acid transport system ATP-binding protein